MESHERMKNSSPLILCKISNYEFNFLHRVWGGHCFPLFCLFVCFNCYEVNSQQKYGNTPLIGLRKITFGWCLRDLERRNWIYSDHTFDEVGNCAPKRSKAMIPGANLSLSLVASLSTSSSVLNVI